jgi:signal transduction histidine kinase
LILIVLLSVAAAVGVVSVAGRRVLAPIGPLTDAVRALGAGDLTARAPEPMRDDEIGTLSGQFNRMAAAMEGLDRAKSEFVANAAHELRTPLAAVSGLTELLTGRDQLSAEELDNVTAALARQGERARILVERMLNLMRIERGAGVTRLQPLNAAHVVGTALTSTPAPEGVKVTTDLDTDLALLGDEVALEQVFTNLLTNAYRYGGPSVHISGAATDDGTVITVEDDGVGVSQRAEEHLFEPFNRGTEISGVGSGLGLAIVRKLLRSMGGDITYERRDPNGARFVIRLQGAGDA